MMKPLLNGFFSFLAFFLLTSASAWAECHPGHSGVPIAYGGGDSGGGGGSNESHGPDGQDMSGPAPDFIGPSLPGGDSQSSGGQEPASGDNARQREEQQRVEQNAGGESLANQPSGLTGDSGTDTIGSQMAADAEKQERQRWETTQKTQGEILEIQQDVTVNKAKNADKNNKAWDDYVND